MIYWTDPRVLREMKLQAIARALFLALIAEFVLATMSGIWYGSWRVVATGVILMLVTGAMTAVFVKKLPATR